MGLAVGIDLGTCNSCVAVVQDGQPVVLRDDEGRTTQPSMVAYGATGPEVAGWSAREKSLTASAEVVQSAKRLIGRRFESTEVQRVRSSVQWGVVEGPNADPRVRVMGRTYAVPEVSAQVLVHMRHLAQEATGEKVDQAVITVPAYFNDQQRQATRDAATIAGLDCLRILNEPTAAALAYGHGQSRQQNIAIYDLGGGTFDVSVLRLDDDLFQVVSTSGDTFLGGDDFDLAIVDHLVEHVQSVHGVDLSQNQSARRRLLQAAEDAKIALSTVDVVPIFTEVIGPDGTTLSVETELDAGTFGKMVMPLIQRSFVVCDDAIAQAGMSVTQLDHILLVGGMTRSPLIRQSVNQYFGKVPDTSLHPDHVVAVGAAIQAHTLTSFQQRPAALLLDVTPQSLGVVVSGGFVEHLIPRNTTVPTDASRVFHTSRDGQTEVRIKVCQGESRRAQENEVLGEFVLSGLHGSSRGTVRVRVTFTMDVDGVLEVKAVDSMSGRAMDMRIEACSGLTAEEVEQMRQAAAMSMPEEDLLLPEPS